MYITSPREISGRTKLLLLFGGPLNQIGWLLFVFFAFFGWGFASQADFSAFFFQGRLETAKGIVSEVAETNASEGNSRIQRFDYRYSVGGTEYSGSSYEHNGPDPGNEVTVEYLPNSPERSRIQGMRGNVFSVWLLLILILPLVPVLLLAYMIRSRVRTLRLLKSGAMAKGKYVSKSETGVTINNHPQYKLTFEFTGSDGNKRTANCRTVDYRKYEQDKEVDILFNPQRADEAVLFDSIPGKPRIEPGGREVTSSGTLAVMILPVLSVIQNGFFFWLFSSGH